MIHRFWDFLPLLPLLPLLLVIVVVLPGCGASEDSGSDAQHVVVYTARKEHLIKPLFDRYRERTGVDVRYITDEAAPLLARLQAEGANTPADILMTVDAGNLWHAAEAGVLAPFRSEILERNVPANLRDPKHRWYGLTIRARALVYNRERVRSNELSTYEALAGESWQGRLCLRTSKKVYNQSLVASLVAALGGEEAEAVVRGWVANLAVPPFANDTMAMEALIAGQCDVTIVNTYYFGRLQKQYDQAGKHFPLMLFWPDRTERGTHVNISGAGLIRYAKHRSAARALLEWLSEPEAQAMLVSLNQEYPVNASAPITAQMTAWGDFKADPIPVAEFGRLQAEAIRLMDRAGYR